MRGDLLRSRGRRAFPSGSSSRNCGFSRTGEKRGCCQPMREFECRENSRPSLWGSAARQNLCCLVVGGFEPRLLLANPGKPQVLELSDRFQKAGPRHHAGRKLPIHTGSREQARATPEPNFASARQSRTSQFGRLAVSTKKTTDSQSESVLKPHLKSGHLKSGDLKPGDLKPGDLKLGDLKGGPERDAD